VEPEFLTDSELATRLKVETGTLRNWRWLRRGPTFHRFEGTIRYLVTDVVEYEKASRQTGEVVTDEKR